MLESVVAAALRFRLLVVGVAAGLIVLGVLSVRQMHSDVLPELGSGPVLEVQTEGPACPARRWSSTSPFRWRTTCSTA